MTSGYTFCACRDCPDTIIASNPCRPELCDDCMDAGCGDPDDLDCQRPDAYGFEESE